MSHPETKPRLRSRRRAVFVMLVVAAALGYAGVRLGQPQSSAAVAGGLPDLFGKAQPPLPKGALQVQDLEADPKGYTGSILVRGVVAKVSPYDPQLFALIDSREARVCQDLHCAKWYLPIKVRGANLKPWDEVNVRGTMTEDKLRQMVYLRVDSVENLGSIKK
ncbi:MAG: hypothetical protein M0Z99_09350 [Betaproteobacteria bacterium]|nr:hypothetical protein [Betaproteobacteria bacterium]